MMGSVDYSWENVMQFGYCTAQLIDKILGSKPEAVAFPIPNGGIHAALVIQSAAKGLRRPFELIITEDPKLAWCYIDDIVDSGATRNSTIVQYGEKPFFALVDKQKNGIRDWVSFPWERMAKEEGPRDNIRRILQYIGEDQSREGLIKTPDRVVRSFEKLYGGYKQRVEDVMTAVFEDGACDEMVIARDIEVYSTCEHHMLPFFGRAHIGYVPNGKVLGVSKLARLLEVFSRRLQIQERLGKQVTSALMEHLQPKGAACVIEAQHLCMLARGVEKQNSVMVTSSLEGVFRNQPATRAEFFSVIQHGR